MPEPTNSDRILRDYSRVALSGVGLLNAETDAALRESVERLVDDGLVLREGDTFTLQPADAQALDAETAHLVDALRAVWLRADDAGDADEGLHGDLGFWTHWWQVLQGRIARDDGSLQMDHVIADDGSFAARDWLGDFDPAVVDHVVSQRLITGRVIVPQSALGTLAADLVVLAERLGFQVRVLSTPVSFAMYDNAMVVLTDKAGDSATARYRVVHRPAVVEPMRQLFELLWAAALPWSEQAKGSAGILRLLAQGLTDEKIAEALNLSVRTVSRRITEVMRAAGATSRFQLGVYFASHKLGNDEG